MKNERVLFEKIENDLVQKHLIEINELQVKHDSTLNSEKANIAIQFDRLTEGFKSQELDFQQKLQELNNEKEKLEKEKDNIQNQTEENLRRYQILETELKQKLTDLSKENEASQVSISEMKNEMSSLKNLLKESENSKLSLETEMKTLEEKMSNYTNLQRISEEKLKENEIEISKYKNDIHKLQILKTIEKDLTAKENQIQDLSKKLKLSINNAKKMETEVC